MSNPTQKCDAQLLFAANMKRTRLGKGMTQERLAESADLHPNYIGSVERGERNISIRNIDRIARALGVSMDDLVTAPATTQAPSPTEQSTPVDSVLLPEGAPPAPE